MKDRAQHLRSCGGTSTSCAVPSLAVQHGSMTSKQIDATIGSLDDRKTFEWFVDEGAARPRGLLVYNGDGA